MKAYVHPFMDPEIDWYLKVICLAWEASFVIADDPLLRTGYFSNYCIRSITYIKPLSHEWPARERANRASY